MSLRRRTIRRLMVLFAAVLVVAGTCAALYLRNEHKKTQRLAEARRVGVAAYKARDFPAPLDALKTYVAREKSHPQAMLAYRVARSRVEASHRQNVLVSHSLLHAVLPI